MKKSILLIAIVAISFASCNDAKQSKIMSYGGKFKVEVISGGQIVRTYISSGKVLSEENSDGYYFNDEQTGKLIEVSGQVIITAL